MGIHHQSDVVAGATLVANGRGGLAVSSAAGEELVYRSESKMRKVEVGASERIPQKLKVTKIEKKT